MLTPAPTPSTTGTVFLRSFLCSSQSRRQRMNVEEKAITIDSGDDKKKGQKL